MYFCSVCDKTYEDIKKAMDCCMNKIHSKEKKWNKMTWIDLVKKYFPNISDEEADFILWEKTAFPMGGLKVVEEQLKELSKESSNDS